MIERSPGIYTWLCAKYLIYVTSTFHTLKDRSYYPHFKVKKTDILGDVKNFHMVTQLMSGISKCQTTCLSLGPKAELQQELQCRHSSGSVIAGQ